MNSSFPLRARSTTASSERSLGASSLVAVVVCRQPAREDVGNRLDELALVKPHLGVASAVRGYAEAEGDILHAWRDSRLARHLDPVRV